MPIFNITYNVPKIIEQINYTVGKPHKWIDRLKLGGIGSRRMVVENRSAGFDDYMLQRHYLTYSNLELRPIGIIVRIHKKLENYAWVLPYGDFSFKKKQDNLIIEAEGDFIEFRDAFVFNQTFIDKLIKQAQTQQL
jgi:hypothetical protein